MLQFVEALKLTCRQTWWVWSSRQSWCSWDSELAPHTPQLPPMTSLCGPWKCKGHKHRLKGNYFSRSKKRKKRKTGFQEFLSQRGETPYHKTTCTFLWHSALLYGPWVRAKQVRWHRKHISSNFAPCLWFTLSMNYQQLGILRKQKWMPYRWSLVWSSTHWKRNKTGLCCKLRRMNLLLGLRLGSDHQVWRICTLDWIGTHIMLLDKSIQWEELSCIF